MNVTFLGSPIKIVRKVNHKIIRVVVKSGMTERSKDLFEKDFSVKSNLNDFRDLLHETSKEHKFKNKMAFFYEHVSNNSWKRVSSSQFEIRYQ